MFYHTIIVAFSPLAIYERLPVVSDPETWVRWWIPQPLPWTASLWETWKATQQQLLLVTKIRICDRKLGCTTLPLGFLNTEMPNCTSESIIMYGKFLFGTMSSIRSERWFAWIHFVSPSQHWYLNDFGFSYIFRKFVNESWNWAKEKLVTIWTRVFEDICNFLFARFENSHFALFHSDIN